MSNPPKAKGTRAESAARQWLRDETGYPIERSALRGNRDVGDLIGLPNTVVEVKNCKTPDPKGWARELYAEVNNACLAPDAGVILWSPPLVGVTRVHQWIAFTFVEYRRDIVPAFGTLAQLHKYVKLMDAWGYVVGVDGLIARTAGTWLVEWRERNVRHDNNMLDAAVHHVGPQVVEVQVKDGAL